MKRYEQFADEIATLIRQGVLGPGERIPSVRQASRHHGISPSTVFQGYTDHRVFLTLNLRY